MQAYSIRNITFSNPPSFPINRIEYWAYSSQISGPTKSKRFSTSNPESLCLLRSRAHTTLLQQPKKPSRKICHSAVSKHTRKLRGWNARPLSPWMTLTTRPLSWLNLQVKLLLTSFLVAVSSVYYRVSFVSLSVQFDVSIYNLSLRLLCRTLMMLI